MPNCQEIEPLVTAWIDDVVSDEGRRIVDDHFRVCPACWRRARAEGSVRELLRSRAAEALRVEPPPDLKARCEALWAPRPTAWKLPRALTRAVPASMAAALAGVLIYGLTASSTRTLAAQLTLDHMKCFALASEPATPIQHDVVETQLQERYGWSVEVPGDSVAQQLRLLGGRRCLYGEGTIAHVLYRHNGSPLSLFMLPDDVRASEIVDVMGHEAIIWAQNDRTFVLLGSEPRPEMEMIASYIRQVVK
jgi:anti-sigma factor RsiW